MTDNPLASLASYSQFLAAQLNRADVVHTTLTVWSTSPYTGVAEGEVIFIAGFRLRMREELDFDEQIIASYGYEIYKEAEKLYWYDDFPHPNHSYISCYLSTSQTCTAQYQKESYSCPRFELREP